MCTAGPRRSTGSKAQGTQAPTAEVRKENHHSKAVCFSFCMVIPSSLTPEPDVNIHIMYSTLRPIDRDRNIIKISRRTLSIRYFQTVPISVKHLILL